MRYQESQLKSRKTVREILQSICAYKGKNKGLTLIEVVISLAIFSLLAVPVAGFVNSSVKMNKKSEVKQQATLLGQSILEELASVDKLVVGMNQLFDKSDVEVLESDSCDESQYCIKGLQLDGFRVELDFTLLNQSTMIEDNQYSVNTLSDLEVVAKDIPDYTGVNIIIDKDIIKANIIGEFQEAVNKQPGVSTIKLVVDNNKKVLINYGNMTKYLSGEISQNNIFYNIEHNNSQHNPIEKIEIENLGSTKLQLCVQNKNANNNGHVQIDLTDISYTGNVDVSVMSKNQDCQFENNLTPDLGTEGEDENPDGDTIPPQQTDALDLFEVNLMVYKFDSTDLLFKGTRVLPLKFE